MAIRCIRAGITGLVSSILLLLPLDHSFADSLPEKARTILLKHCAECHSESGSESKWLVSTGDLSEADLRLRIKEKNAAESTIIRRIKDTDNPMPPSDAKNPKLSEADLATLELWISEGALPIGGESENLEVTKKVCRTRSKKSILI